MLYDVPTPILIIFLLLLMAAGVEAGLRLGRRFGRTTWTNAKEILTGLSAATLALLGLMLAFTFSQAAARYDVRQNALVKESNVILVVGHFLDYLAPEPRTEAQGLLRDYTAARIAYLTVGYDAAREEEAVRSSRELADELWQIVRTGANYEESEVTLRGLRATQLTEAVSEMGVAAHEREEARARRVPSAVMSMLFAMAVLATGMVAYMAGATHAPHRPKFYMFLLFIGLVIYVIVDLDRPRRGLMQLSPAALEETLSIISKPH